MTGSGLNIADPIQVLHGVDEQGMGYVPLLPVMNPSLSLSGANMEKSDAVSGGGRTCGVSLDLRLRWRVASLSGGAALVRLLVVLRSARASTGRLGGRWSGVSGCGLRWSQDSAVLPPEQWICHLLSALQVAGPPPTGPNVAVLLPSRGPCHEKGEALPTPPPRAPTILPSCAEARTLLRWRRDPVSNAASLALQRSNAESCVHRRPQPENPSRRRCQPPGRGPSGDHPSASRGSAPASRDPLRQRTSEPRPPAAAHQRAETPCGSAPSR